MSKAQDWLYTFRSENALKLKKTAKTISIVSGKGGVGKTSTALKIGLELSQTGHKVLLLDCDYNLSNTFLKLGLPLNEDFYLFVRAEKDFEECIYKMGNFHLMSGCNGSLDLFGKDINLDTLIINLINLCGERYDYILLDCPAGISEEVLNLNAFCQERFFIVTPDKSSLTDSYSLMKILKLRYGIRENHLIVNRYVSSGQLERVVRSISGTAKNFLGCEIRFLGGIKEYENKLESFDDTLFGVKNNILHKNFVKVIKNYTDQLCEIDDRPRNLNFTSI